jgi:hypothetical protein
MTLLIHCIISWQRVIRGVSVLIIKINAAPYVLHISSFLGVKANCSHPSVKRTFSYRSK